MITTGVVFRPQSPPQRLREVVEATEAAGVAELWLWEDLLMEGGLTAAAAALAWSERLRIGIGLLPVTLRNPALVAMEIATLGHLFPDRSSMPSPRRTAFGRRSPRSTPGGRRPDAPTLLGWWSTSSRPWACPPTSWPTWSDGRFATWARRGPRAWCSRAATRRPTPLRCCARSAAFADRYFVATATAGICVAGNGVARTRLRIPPIH